MESSGAEPSRVQDLPDCTARAAVRTTTVQRGLQVPLEDPVEHGLASGTPVPQLQPGESEARRITGHLNSKEVDVHRIVLHLERLEWQRFRNSQLCLLSDSCTDL